MCLTAAVGCTVGGTDALSGPGDPVDSVRLEVLADGFVSPVALLDPADGSGRLFVVDQIGRIEIVDGNGERVLPPFLDLTDRVIGLSSSYDERGLLGLAFHPDYATNGRFFVYYTAAPDTATGGIDGVNRVSQFRVSDADANQADADGERVLLAMDSPQPNHNGGQLAFGPDGFLYIGTGDGGGANDAGAGHTVGTGNGQDASTLLGKILRIDVDRGDPYDVPADNPFVGSGAGRPEIWALGFRNPWRFSFDTGGANRLFVGDVGQNRFEEVDIVQRGGNYGWSIREGGRCLDGGDACATRDPTGTPLSEPIVEYPHVDQLGRPVGISVIGGFVYRGGAVPALQGRYVFGDYSAGFLIPDGRLFAADETDDGRWTFREVMIDGTATGRIGRFVLAFGQDATGELYVLTSDRTGVGGTTGRVSKIVAGR